MLTTKSAKMFCNKIFIFGDMKQFLYLIAALSSLTAFAQTDNTQQTFFDFINESFDHYELKTKELKNFTVHVKKSAKKGKKPLLLYLEGSTNHPIYYSTKAGTYKAVPLDIDRYGDDYHVVLISKPTIPFIDSLQQDEQGRTYYPLNDTYKSLYSLDWRVKSASHAIDLMFKKLDINKEKVIVMGYSEGTDVAPRVAVMNKKVTHVVCFGGNALNPFYNFLIEARLKAQKGQISHDESQRIVDSLYTEFGKIYADPKSITKNWYGETNLKWSSFTKTIPLESLLQLDIPILYLSGAKDDNQTVIDIDYAYLEFLRKGKTNFTYKVYPNCDHFFTEEKTLEDGTRKTENRIREVHQFALDWVNNK